eukprot:m.10338 g.10338  ORF g.10338 m.10338 type:complete len:251 (-) comp3759_c0_seq1:126-878(-)
MAKVLPDDLLCVYCAASLSAQHGPLVEACGSHDCLSEVVGNVEEPRSYTKAAEEAFNQGHVSCLTALAEVAPTNVTEGLSWRSKDCREDELLAVIVRAAWSCNQLQRVRRAISAACERGMTQTVLVYLDTTTDDHEPVDDQLLVVASQHGQANVVRLLLDHGAKPNAFPKGNAQSALREAAATGSLACVQLLLRAGAKADACLPGTMTPAEIAALGGHSHCVDALREAGADFDDDVNTVNDSRFFFKSNW